MDFSENASPLLNMDFNEKTIVDVIEECVRESIGNDPSDGKFHENDRSLDAPRDDMYLIANTAPGVIYDKISNECKTRGISDNTLDHRVLITSYDNGTFVRVMHQDR